MSQMKPVEKSIAVRYKLAIETGALVAILIMPVFLYLAAEARAEIAASVLLAILAGLMLALLRLR